MNIVVQFVIAGLVMGAIDALWLGVIARTLYRDLLGNMLLDKPNMIAAVSFYVIYIIGVVAFVVSPALERGSWQYALGYGALFGFVAYATYDLTNLATLKKWPVKLVVIDLIWGSVLTALVAVVTCLVVNTWL